MTPLQPIHNPLGSLLGNTSWGQWHYNAKRCGRYKTGGHYEPDNSFQRHEIPLGRLIQLNPKLLK